MIANRINKNHELVQLEHIRKARENLRIALEAERAVKKGRKKRSHKSLLGRADCSCIMCRLLHYGGCFVI